MLTHELEFLGAVSKVARLGHAAFVWRIVVPAHVFDEAENALPTINVA